ncbi:MAG: hypothetical protein ABIF71_13470 [Planctomycetota bacterium]
MRHIVIITVACLCLSALPAMAQVESELMKELLAGKKYEAGLTLDGLSGFVITSSTDTLVKGDWFVGVDAFLDPTQDDITGNDFGFTFSTAFGLIEDVWGPFKNFEIAASVPFYGTAVDADAELNMGDAILSGKLQWIEFDSLRPEMPSIAFVGSLLVPSGDEGYTYLDLGGVEGGMVFGTRVPDSSGDVDFRVYLELRGAYVDTADGQDIFFKSNLGISFPLADMPDAYLLMEGRHIWASQNGEDGNTYSWSLRSQAVDRNLSAGMKFRSFSDSNTNKRQIFLMYDLKF